MSLKNALKIFFTQKYPRKDKENLLNFLNAVVLALFLYCEQSKIRQFCIFSENLWSEYLLFVAGKLCLNSRRICKFLSFLHLVNYLVLADDGIVISRYNVYRHNQCQSIQLPTLKMIERAKCRLNLRHRIRRPCLLPLRPRVATSI